jgi:PAS domain S-box-containing protein
MSLSLFTQGHFAPHGTCLLWEPGLLWLHMASDIATGLAYFVIPVGLASLVFKRRDLAFGWMFWLFALFIVACGTTHFMDVWVLWHPDYAVQGLLKAFTAAASVMTAALLWQILPQMLTVPTSEQFQKISDRLTAETVRHEHTVEQLRRTEANFQLLVESVHDCAMFMVDRLGNVSSWNAGAQHITQYKESEIVGRHFSCFYTSDEQAAGKPMRALAIAAADGTYQEEGWRVRKNGSLFIAEVVINPILDRAGDLIGFAEITRDITQRKKAEEDLELARAALAQSQKMEAVGQLTGGIAHDFNNMLTAILGSVELLEIRQDTFSPGATRMLQVIRHAADHGAELTRRLLAFSRKQALAPAATDIDLLVSGMSELLRRTLGESIEIESKLASGLWRAFVDPNQIESALVNLAVNARDAMRNGGKLTIETGNTFLDEQYTRQHPDISTGEYIFIAVSDTGTGMPADVLEHVFEPFYTTKEVGRGTGLGLSQIYGFVRQSNGHVEIYSEVGRGTTVKMFFPRFANHLEPREWMPLPDSGPLLRGTETILVVDDDEDVLNYSVNAARHLGFDVLESNSATKALAILDARPDIRLLFTDVGLPGMNGRELADNATAKLPGVKVVFTSGYARTVAGLGLPERGVQFLPKPFRIGSLAHVLRSALDEV